MRVKGIVIFLICLICLLSILDAPEYVRCAHIDLCEFLEIHAHLNNILKSDLIMYISHMQRNNFFSMLECIISNKKLIQNLILFCIALILSPFKIICDIKNKKDLFSKNVACTHPSVENRLIAQNLEFIKISVIRSWNPSFLKKYKKVNIFSKKISNIFPGNIRILKFKHCFFLMINNSSFIYDLWLLTWEIIIVD